MHVMPIPGSAGGPSALAPAEPRTAAAKRIERDIRGAERVDLDIVVERGEPAPMILEAVERLGVGLILAGVSRADTLGKALLGTTVEKLTRKSQVPVLVVKERPRGPYANPIVAADFSDGSRRALEVTLELFGSAGLTLFHAFAVPFEGMLEDRSAARESAAAKARGECLEFVSKIPAAAGRPIASVCQFGDVGYLLGELAEKTRADLVAVGTQGRGAVSGMLLGSVAHRLLSEIQTDVLVVRR